MGDDLRATDFCPQCYRDKPLEQFLSRNGKRFVRWCMDCRDRYRGWETFSVAERRKRMKPKPRNGIGFTASLVIGSKNRKLGGIPVSMTDMASCPTSCPLRDKGCYAEFGKTRYHWERVAGVRGRSWREFCLEVAALPDDQLWRHNEAGDLPGRGDELDVHALEQLVRANRGRRGFTFTHKPLRDDVQRAAVRAANAAGFTINLSADSLEHADARAELELGPVAVVLPVRVPPRIVTPRGREVMVCLHQTRGLTCAECAICASTTRDVIVGFRAHGQAAAIVSDLVQLRRRPRPALVEAS